MGDATPVRGGQASRMHESNSWGVIDEGPLDLDADVESPCLIIAPRVTENAVMDAPNDIASEQDPVMLTVMVIAEYRCERGRLVATVSGTFDPEAALRRFENLILPTCRAQGLTQVLMDVRNVVGAEGVVPGILYATQRTNLYARHLRDGGSPLRIAYVAPPASVASWNPGSEILEKDGVLEAYVTGELDAAIAWLEG